MDKGSHLYEMDEQEEVSTSCSMNDTQEFVLNPVLNSKKTKDFLQPISIEWES